MTHKHWLSAAQRACWAHAVASPSTMCKMSVVPGIVAFKAHKMFGVSAWRDAGCMPGNVLPRRILPSASGHSISPPRRPSANARLNNKTSHANFTRQLQAILRGHPRSVTVCAAETDVDLAAEVRRLQAENQALRQELSLYQQCAPENVVVGSQAAHHEAFAGTVAAPDAAPAPSLEQQLESGINWPSPGSNFWEVPPRTIPLPIAPPPSLGRGRDQRQMHIVHVTAEMAPVAKVGGLGDVVTGLSKATLARGHNVEIMLPFYECIPNEAVEGLQLDREFSCPKGRMWDGEMQLGELATQVWRGKIDGCPVLLVRPDWNQSNLFKGSRIYGGSYNETEAYLYFCRACLEYLRLSGRQPDVMHCHEWQSAAMPMLFWEYFHWDMGRTRCMFTIHNMDSSGEVREDEFAHTGMSGEFFKTIDKALDERTIGHNPERLCLLKGGIVYSNLVTTVSPGYAKETLMGGAAGWLKSTLAKPEVADKYVGVLNGIDVTSWDPATDPLLPAAFNAQMPGGKQLCKRFLQEGLGMNVDPQKPIVACITRLVPQKGIHLIEHAVRRTAELGGQFVLLGTGHADSGLKNMAENTFRDNPDIQLKFIYSETLAHMMYAASDMFLVPSMFEPCGLTQMIALRYGSVPVVRATGGLADTVKDFDNCQEGGVQRNGFVFDGIDAASLNGALDRAVQAYKTKPDWWRQAVKQNMEASNRWSWEQATEAYVQLYNKVTGW